MKPAELRDMTDADLREHVDTARRELFGLRFQHATGELDNTAGLARAKRFDWRTTAAATLEIYQRAAPRIRSPIFTPPLTNAVN